MLRRLIRFLAPVLLALVLGAPAALAQGQTAPAEGDKSEHSVSALPYAVMMVYTLAVLTIVCMPSRKA